MNRNPESLWRPSGKILKQDRAEPGRIREHRLLEELDVYRFLGVNHLPEVIIPLARSGAGEDKFDDGITSCKELAHLIGRIGKAE